MWPIWNLCISRKYKIWGTFNPQTKQMLSEGDFRSRVWGLGIRVQGLGFRVQAQGLGFRVRSLEFRIEDLAFGILPGSPGKPTGTQRVQGQVFGVRGLGFRVQAFILGLGLRFRVQVSWFRFQGLALRVQGLWFNQGAEIFTGEVSNSLNAQQNKQTKNTPEPTGSLGKPTGTHRVWGQALSVQGLGFKVPAFIQGIGPVAQGLGLMVQSWRFGVGSLVFRSREI